MIQRITYGSFACYCSIVTTSIRNLTFFKVEAIKDQPVKEDESVVNRKCSKNAATSIVSRELFLH